MNPVFFPSFKKPSSTLAALGLCRLVRAAPRALLGFLLRRLLLLQTRGCGASASVVAAQRLGSCGPQAELPRGVQHPSGPGVEAVTPVSAGGFLSTVFLQR